MSENTEVLGEPLFPDLDQREWIPLAEVAQRIGYTQDQVRNYAKTGTIPGGRQAGRGKRWVFQRELLEKWWQYFSAPKPEELKWK